MRLFDTFAGSAGNLSAHISDSGNTWAKTASGTYAADININGGRAIGNNGSLYNANWEPVDADYDVVASVHFNTVLSQQFFLQGRIDVSNTNRYAALVDALNGRFSVHRFSSGTGTTLSFVAQTWTAGQTYDVKLEMRGTSIKAYLDGVLKVTVTDSTITAKGRVGLRWTNANSTTTTGIVLSDMYADDGAWRRQGTLLTFV